MAVPWLRLIDTAIGFVDYARSRRSRTAAAGDSASQLEAGARSLGGLETRLAGVVVAALKEAFDRDTRRLELEREQLDAERQRAERALRLERLRQAADREIGRLRQFAVVAAACWIGTLFFSPRLLGAGAGTAPRALLGTSWVLLLAAMAAAFAGQSAIARALQEEADPLPSPVAGTIAPWLLVAGLALVAAVVLSSQF